MQLFGHYGHMEVFKMGPTCDTKGSLSVLAVHMWKAGKKRGTVYAFMSLFFLS